MPTVTLPQLGESITEGTVTRWLKQPGEPVALDEPICEIETEKITAELPSPFAGTLGEVLVPEGETVEVGAPLCTIVESSAAAPATRAAAVPAAIPAQPRPDPGATPQGITDVSRTHFYSPVVLRLAAEHRVDLAGIRGTGIGGRVTRRDVERHLAEATAPPSPKAAAAEPAARPSPRPATAPAAYETVPLSPTRRAIAANLQRSSAEAPQAWTMVEVDVTELLRERDRDRAGADASLHLTLLPYVVHAVCLALPSNPSLNARWEEGELRRYHAVHCGIAVAAETGLVVPVIHDAGDLSVPGLARRIADLAERARERRLTLADVEGGTITVNNTGAFGSIASRPIVNHPEVAIVTLERVVRRPVVVGDDAIAIRSMVNLCLTFDHRALDGHEAGRFLADLRSRLERRAP